MLQPGMCSASLSETRTWIGPPGALATQAAIAPSSAGGRFGPPVALLESRQRRLRSACAICHAEIPVEHLVLAAVPLVGPREHERPGATCSERGVDLRADSLCLPVQSFPNAVGAELCEQHRFLA